MPALLTAREVRVRAVRLSPTMRLAHPAHPGTREMHMPMSEKDAAIAADNLLVQLIKSQPNLLAPKSLYSSVGKEAGEAIAALRVELIKMYQTQP